MQKQSTENHGEGNTEAADRFNHAERDFINSPQGKQKIAQGAKVAPGEEAELAEAENKGRERAKGEDPRL